LPGMALPCGLCRVSTHGNAFAISIAPFAVLVWRTTTKLFPVVLGSCRDFLWSWEEDPSSLISPSSFPLAKF
jgi:hypothetical protein